MQFRVCLLGSQVVVVGISSEHSPGLGAPRAVSLRVAAPDGGSCRPFRGTYQCLRSTCQMPGPCAGNECTTNEAWTLASGRAPSSERHGSWDSNPHKGNPNWCHVYIPERPLMTEHTAESTGAFHQEAAGLGQSPLFGVPKATPAVGIR